MATIKNPILTGFHPDPSICRAGEDYYIAVSTFEWFPGVGIYHSKDLKHWRLVARPLNRLSQLNMIGNPDSGGSGRRNCRTTTDSFGSSTRM